MMNSVQALASFIDSAITIGIGLYLTLGRSRIVSRITDPRKKERMSHVLWWAGPVVIFSGVVLAATKVETLEDPATRAARMINSSSPQMIDPITRFDRATAGPGQRVVIDQTITTAVALEISESEWNRIVPELRKKIENSTIGKFPAQGVTIVYRYHDKYGARIGEVVLAAPPTRH